MRSSLLFQKTGKILEKLGLYFLKTLFIVPTDKESIKINLPKDVFVPARQPVPK